MNCSTISGLTNLSLVPSNTTSQVVILTDKNLSYGILATDDNTVALSHNMVALLEEAFASSYPSTLGDLETAFGCTARDILVNFNNDRILSLVANPQDKTNLRTYPVNAGDPINPSSSSQVIIAEYTGRVLCFQIGSIGVYIYYSATPLHTINPTTCVPEGDYGIGDFGEFGNTLYPVPAQSALGANCNVCGACGGCGACGACALCGGLNFGAAAIALVAVDAALAVTSALAAFAPNLD